MMRVAQEIAVTTGGLVRVAVIAVVGFGLMALMVDDRSRPLTITIGIGAVVMVGAVVVYLQRQRRFGSATLSADHPFVPDRMFSGRIETDFTNAPRSPIRIRIAGWSSRNEVTLARTTVESMSLQRGADGSIEIPFHVPPSDELTQWHPREIRLHARAADWPLGWGATFVIAKRD